MTRPIRKATKRGTKRRKGGPGKTAVQTTVKAPVVAPSARLELMRGATEKVPQPHGGALSTGGTPGNRGGLGRPSSAVRALATLEFDKRIPILCAIADGVLTETHVLRDGTRIEVGPSLREQMRAIVALAMIGMGTRVEVDPAPTAGWNLSFTVAPAHPAVAASPAPAA